jgi:hypothetical protein
MDPARFDMLVRSLTAWPSRRRLLAIVPAGLVASLPFALGESLSLFGLADVDAKRKKKRKRKKKKSRNCTSNCAGKLCGDDGCGGLCGFACSGGKTCQDGACACPSGQKECRGQEGTCATCCEPDDCPAGQICSQGRCGVVANTCASGYDSCIQVQIPCRTDFSCICFATWEGQTRCASNTASLVTGCGTCTSDAQCAALRPDIPGVFCAKGGGLACPGCTGFCLSPCPS